MKQSTRTLPQAIKLFPESWSKVCDRNIPDNFYNLSWEEKLNYVGRWNSTYYCSNKNGKLFFGLRLKVIKRVGKKFYPEINWTNTIVVEGTKISVNKLSLSGLLTFLRIIGIDMTFITSSNQIATYSLKSCVIADILRKKVYNEETLCRCILSKIYHLKGFDWKLFYKYTKCANNLSIYDLKDFTKDITKSMQVLVNLGAVYKPIYQDLLSSAVKLNEVVNFTWSKRRIKEEHQRQINELNRKQVDAKEQIPVFDIRLDEPNIRMLNTEKEVFLEATTMHHCLYNCYWNSIKNKSYVAFHMFSPENCTFSFKILNDNVILDQAFLAYDQKISDLTREAIIDFQKRNETDLYKMLTRENKANWPEEIDLPY